MRVLVTGCAGMIGSVVSRALLECGVDVIGIDSLDGGHEVCLKQWRLAQLQHDVGFTFERVDVSDRPALDGLFSERRVDAVVNLAARAGVRRSVADPVPYYETNVTGTLHLLECCKRHKVPKFVLASTSSLYGGVDRPFREDQPTDRPLSPYAASKKAAETLCHAYHHLTGLDVTIVRYFTVYGPAGRPDMAVFRFIRWIAEGEPVVVYGDGSQERDFTYVHDIAAGTVAALKPLGYEIVNLGSDRPVSVNRLIALLEALLDRKARLVHRPVHPADAQSTWADIGKARRLLGWAPRTLLEEGLRDTVRWYQEHRSWASQIGGSK